MKRRCMICLLLICLMLTACGTAPDSTTHTTETTTTTTASTTETTSVTPTEETTPPTTAPVKEWKQVYEGKFPELHLHLASGAGAWGTSLKIQEDGSFSGSFLDSDMGDSGDNYPDGTRYVSRFTGTFKIAEVSTYTAYLRMTALTTEEEKGKTWYADNVRYIATDAYGLTGQTEYVLYLPNTPVNELPKDTAYWNWTKLGEKTIDCFVLYCPANGNTFFGS